MQSSLGVTKQSRANGGDDGYDDGYDDGCGCGYGSAIEECH